MAQKSVEMVVSGLSKESKAEVQRLEHSELTHMHRKESTHAEHKAEPAFEGFGLGDRLMLKVAGDRNVWNLVQTLIIAAPPVGAVVAAVAYGAVGMGYLIDRANSKS